MPRRSIPSSHATRSFFFWIVGYHAPRKTVGRRKLRVPAVEETRRRKSLATLWERDLGSHKMFLRAPSPFQLTRHVVRDISWMLTVAPIGSLDSRYLSLAYYSLNFKRQPSKLRQASRLTLYSMRHEFLDANDMRTVCWRSWEAKRFHAARVKSPMWMNLIIFIIPRH